MRGIINSIDFLGGEPFERENFDKILQKCEACNIDYSIITNGQIEEIRLKEILTNKMKLRTILVSLEGLKEENDYIRGKGVFDKAIKTILCLKRIRDEGSNKFTIGINMTLNNLNKYDIDGILKLAINELNVDYIQISPILNIANAAIHKELLLKDEDKIKCYMQLAEYIKREQLQEKVRLSFNNQLLPEFLDAMYDVDFLSETRVFCMNGPCCFYEDENQEVTAVYYPVVGEKVEYEKEGYEILKQIKQSVNHVSQEAGYEEAFL